MIPPLRRSSKPEAASFRCKACNSTSCWVLNTPNGTSTPPVSCRLALTGDLSVLGVSWHLPIIRLWVWMIEPSVLHSASTRTRSNNVRVENWSLPFWTETAASFSRFASRARELLFIRFRFPIREASSSCETAESKTRLRSAQFVVERFLPSLQYSFMLICLPLSFVSFILLKDGVSTCWIWYLCKIRLQTDILVSEISTPTMSPLFCSLYSVSAMAHNFRPGQQHKSRILIGFLAFSANSSIFNSEDSRSNILERSTATAAPELTSCP